jgi:hypothetical protein
MARRSLRPELNRIRGWVRQGRTDAWIAHQLEVTVQQIQTFKREQGLEPDDTPDAGTPPDLGDEIDLRAEDDALIAAELDAAEARRAAGTEEEPDDEERPARRRRGRRGGRTTTRTPRKGPMTFEATFDHGEEEGYGLWLDPAVQDDAIYAEYWAGHRPVEVSIGEDQIIIRRAGSEEADEEE